MKTFLKTTTALGFMLAVSLAAASPSLSKAHDQGQTASPGTNVGQTTVMSAQTLGARIGKGNGAQGTLGNSGMAGRPAK